MEPDPQSNSSWLDRPLSSLLPKMNIENLLAALILVLAIASRFYMLDARVMSHDEVNHVVPSYDLFQGRGYRHDPVTHGPMQFHLVALSYYLFGDNDFTSRIPAALFSIAAVGVVLFGFRRYLGRSGALIGGLMFTISPYLLFYGRYTRNEGFLELFAVLLLWGILYYLEKGKVSTLYLLAVVMVLHFITKETSFIYAAQFLLFVGFLFLEDVVKLPWPDANARTRFTSIVILGFALLGIALGLAVWNAEANPVDESGAPVAGAVDSISSTPLVYGETLAVILAVLLAILAVVILIRSLGIDKVRSLRSFDMLMLIGTLVLPQLSAFPVKMVGWDPLDYQLTGMLRTAVFLGLFLVLSAVAGLWWRPRVWLISAAAFYTIYIVFYTTFFTNGQGFFTGIIGSLGYWLSQQSVERGSQPWYYFGLIQMPLYEFLPVAAMFAALYFGVRYNRFSNVPGPSPAFSIEPIEPVDDEEGGELDEINEEQPKKLPILALLVYWSVSALIAYTMAGEKMPWLTVHIALPTALAGAWGLGYLVDMVDWKQVTGRRGILTLMLIPVLLTASASVIGGLLGDNPPFMGKTLQELTATNLFLFALVMTGVSAGLIVHLVRGWSKGQVLQLIGLVFFALLALQTVRTAYRANYINYDYAKEYLVYAHAAPGPKEVLAEVEEISRRITGGKDLKVAYDNDGLYPYWWYFRDWPNRLYYTDKPTRNLRDYPVIIAGDTNYGKLEPIVREDYYSYETMRLWWPNQDYFGLTWERLWGAISDPKMRAAIFQIWLNRDFTDYAALTGSTTLTPETWQPGGRMRVYIRKDIIGQIWNYGAAPAVVGGGEVQQDPYEGKIVTIAPDLVLGANGSEPGQFQAPRGVAAAPDGSIYVADSGNHRIQHFSADGQLINSWGSFGDVNSGSAPGGTFNEPWSVAVAPDGTVYVADTWNHRIQKFNAAGELLGMWGYFGQAEKPEGFWGPRSLAVDSNGRVYVSDTGNKRIVIFDADGNYISQFGIAGLGLGEFDEQVGIALDAKGNLYVADTWNQRVQVFAPDAGGITFTPLRSWDVYGWFGQSLDNKPYIAVTGEGNVIVTDPEGYRLLEFTADGSFVRGWNGIGGGEDAYSMPTGVTVDSEGRIWTVDAGNHYLVRFVLPGSGE